MDNPSLNRKNRFLACFVTLAGIAGLASSSSWLPAGAAALVMPFAVIAQGTRRAAFAVAFVFYAATTWSQLHGPFVFSSVNAPRLNFLALWLAASVILASPYYLFWITNCFFRPLGVATAVLAASIPLAGLESCMRAIPFCPVSFPWSVVVSCLAFILIALKPN